jgi:hypothetical protein
MPVVQRSNPSPLDQLAGSIQGERQVKILGQAAVVEMVAWMGFDKIPYVYVVVDESKTGVSASHTGVEGRLLRHHQGCAGDQRQLAFAQRLLQRRPGHWIDPPPGVGFEK